MFVWLPVAPSPWSFVLVLFAGILSFIVVVSSCVLMSCLGEVGHNDL